MWSSFLKEFWSSSLKEFLENIQKYFWEVGGGRGEGKLRFLLARNREG